MAQTRDVLWAEFDKIGEEAVRERITLRIYSGDALHFTEEWLRRKETARQSSLAERKEASSREQINIARSAKNAAWAAAIAAAIAIIVSIISLVISLQ